MGLRPQIPPAGVWLLLEGLSYSVSYPVNSGRKAGSEEAETATPREMRKACGISDGSEEDCEELERDSFMKENER